MENHAPHPRRVLLSLKGSGTISLRVRALGSKAWRYCNAPFVKHTKSARYAQWASDTWQRVTLDLRGLTGVNRGIELELRAAKRSAVELLFDRVTVE